MLKTAENRFLDVPWRFAFYQDCVNSWQPVCVASLEQSTRGSTTPKRAFVFPLSSTASIPLCEGHKHKTNWQFYLVYVQYVQIFIETGVTEKSCWTFKTWQHSAVSLSIQWQLAVTTAGCSGCSFLMPFFKSWTRLATINKFLSKDFNYGTLCVCRSKDSFSIFVMFK